MTVLDTHALIWMDADDAALGPQARARIEQAWRAGEVAVTGQHGLDLAALAELIRASGVDLPVSVDSLRLINPFAVEFRYDDEIVPSITRDELETLVMKVLGWAVQCLELASGDHPDAGDREHRS